VIWVFFTVIAVLLVGAVAALVTGRLGYDPMADATSTQGEPALSDGFSSDEISAVRFDTALRGYRMDQVDAVLDRLQARISELESSSDRMP
jgi:DivIVA domain-containing protein